MTYSVQRMSLLMIFCLVALITGIWMLAMASLEATLILMLLEQDITTGTECTPMT